MSLKFTRLSPLAFSPIRATDLSAGVDLVTPVHFVVPSWGKHQVFLDLAFELLFPLVLVFAAVLFLVV